MYTSASMSSSLSLCSPSYTPFLIRRRFNPNFPISTQIQIRPPRNPTRHLIQSASIAEKNSTSFELSWNTWDKVDPDDFNGWAFDEIPPKPVIKKGLSKFVVIGVGASVAAVLGLLAYFSLSTKGFRLRSPFNTLHGFTGTSLTSKDDDIISEQVSHDVPLDNAEAKVENLGDFSEASVAAETGSNTVNERKLERVIVPFTVDYVQQEALSTLKKLKIIEDDVRADELCTRREYARWLVRANSQFERIRKHRIVSAAALSGSSVTAFDDVGVEDPDFEFIQCTVRL